MKRITAVIGTLFIALVLTYSVIAMITQEPDSFSSITLVSAKSELTKSLE